MREEHPVWTLAHPMSTSIRTREVVMEKLRRVTTITSAKRVASSRLPHSQMLYAIVGTIVSESTFRPLFYKTKFCKKWHKIEHDKKGEMA